MTGINGVEFVGNVLLALPGSNDSRIGYGFTDEEIVRTYPKRCLMETEPWVDALQKHKKELPKIDIKFPEEGRPRKRTSLRILQKMREAWENDFWLGETEYY